MIVNGIIEGTITYPTAEVGSPPFANVVHYYPRVAPSAPQDEVDELAADILSYWDPVIDLLDSGLTGVTMRLRLLSAGVVYEATSATMAGAATGAQLVGGGSVRCTLATTHAYKQRNGAIFLPGVPAAASGANNGDLTSGFRTSVQTALENCMFIAGTTNDWDLCVASKIPDSDPAEYEPRLVTGVTVAARSTFYDTRY